MAAELRLRLRLRLSLGVAAEHGPRGRQGSRGRSEEADLPQR